MILRGRRKSHGHPELPFFGFDLYSVLTRARSRLPLIADHPVALLILKQPPLACIETSDKPCILLHSVLNHYQTPEMVVDFILTHELLHLLVPPKEINGIMKSHPPEFREAERRTFPEVELAWNWLIMALGPWLKRDPKKETTFVKATWRRLVRVERPSIEQVSKLLNPKMAELPLI
jgi:hypothetical protein